MADACYDGKEFAVTRKFSIWVDRFQENKELWMRGCSVLVGCMYVALSNGDFVDGNKTRRLVEDRIFLFYGMIPPFILPVSRRHLSMYLTLDALSCTV